MPTRYKIGPGGIAMKPLTKKQTEAAARHRAKKKAAPKKVAPKKVAPRKAAKKKTPRRMSQGQQIATLKKEGLI